MHTLPFDKPGKFWRGNLHTHSTRSDGTLTPEAVCEVYRQAGYDFLALTDHFTAMNDFPLVDTRPYRTADFTTILGAELHTGRTELGQRWHILAVGLPLDFAPHPADETGPEAVQRALEAGAYVAVAHPQWYGLTESDVMSLNDAHAIEVYNGICDVHNDRPDSLYMLDLMLARGQRFTACATDDAHFVENKSGFMTGWVWVKSEELDPDSLLASLKAGAYYSSTGPQIHDIQVYPGEKIVVRCSPVERIFVTGTGAQTANACGTELQEAELSLEAIKSPYCRVTVRDAKRRRAWSNPIWFDELR